VNARLPLAAFCAFAALSLSAHSANALLSVCSALDGNSGVSAWIGFPFAAGETITTTTTDPHTLTVTSFDPPGISDEVGPALGNSYTFTQTGTYAVSTGGPEATWTCSDLPPNAAPVANAGSAQSVASAASVTLDGSTSSDGDNDPLTYNWTQISGPPVTLSDPTTSNPTFTAPTLSVGQADVTLVFSLTVNDGTVDSAADTVTITVTAPSATPATEFAASDDTIRAVIVDDATRSLQSTIASNRRLVRDARARFVYQQQASADPGQMVSRNDVPFDIDGGIDVTRMGVDARGTFFQQSGSGDGSTRRVFFGDFDIQHDSGTGSSTATLTGSIAWERMVSDKTMLGYFIGGELARSTIDGAFDGTQKRIGVNAGGYAVHQFGEALYLDGFLSFGAGRNNLEIADGVLALDSDYTTRTATFGAAVSGIYALQGYGFRPELSLSYGRTWIGDVDFTGRAYGLVDNRLSLDAGSVTMANVTLRPEVLVPLDGRTPDDSISFVSFAPRLICEQVRAVTTVEICGGGAEIGISSRSEDGLSAVSARIVADRLGERTNTAFQLNLEHRF
jgi:outer membrane autotransporter protein